MMTLAQAIAKVQRKLDDTEGKLWSREQISSWVQEGYDGVCRDGECLFDMVMFTADPQPGNHTREFEEQFMTGPIYGRFNYTRDSEDRYVGPSDTGPMNHTNPAQGATMTTGTPPSTRRTAILPDTLVKIDRVTHNWLMLQPEHARYLRQVRIIYETLQGGVYSWTMGQDGFNVLRVIGVPVTLIPTITITGLRGGIRQVTDYGFSSETVIGTYGGIRSLPRHYQGGPGYGGIRRIIPDDYATRVEFFRMGVRMGDNDIFEIPDRAMKYALWWVMFRAFSTPGRGESKKLADHFRARYEAGVERMRNRVEAEMDERTIAMGGKRDSIRDSYLEHFPSDYGRKRAFRRG